MAWREWTRCVSHLWDTLRPRLTDLGHRVYWDLRDMFSRPQVIPESEAVRFRVLFVCFGNICRSPLAEEILRQKVAREGLAGLVRVDSAGTSAWNIGRRPHWKARACAVRHGLAIHHHRARLFTPLDFDRFDRILVMDRQNQVDVLELAPGSPATTRVHLLLDFAGGGEIPDPINGPPADFDSVFHQIDAACGGVVEDVVREVGRRTPTAPCPTGP